jgi:maltose/moltooligosaccharide transporter
MPNAMTLWTAVLALWVLDASLNFTMGPYRAFVADQMSAEQRSTGYLMYMFFASVARRRSLLPGRLRKLRLLACTAGRDQPRGEIRVRRGCHADGAGCLWSAFTSREFAPEVLERFDSVVEADADRSPEKMRRHGYGWVLFGSLGCFSHDWRAFAGVVRAGVRRAGLRRLPVDGER